MPSLTQALVAPAANASEETSHSGYKYKVPPPQAFGFVSSPHTYVSRKDEGDKMIVLERGDLVMVFNFHPSNSYQDYRVGCLLPGPYKVPRVFKGKRSRSSCCCL